MILEKRKYPVEGETKVVKKYAWWPVWVGDKKIWLHGYQLTYEYKVRFRPPPFNVYMPSPLVKMLEEIHKTTKFGGWDLIGEQVF